jgi:hypothetical protein
MRNLGSRLEAWLRKHPEHAAGRLELALDMVRLEWAEIDAFDGAAQSPFKRESLAGADLAKVRLRLQPYVHLLDLHYPVDDLLLAIKHHAGTDVASNAFNERQKRRKVSAVARLKPAAVYLAVHRVDFFVYFRRLEREEFTILNALRKGRTLDRAVELGFRSSAIPMSERPDHAAAWFQNWAALGWFVSEEGSSKTIPS